MQTGGDPRNVLSALLIEAMRKITQLMEGFYHNTEDGLFEIAYASENVDQRQKIVELMRELRFQRNHLMKSFDDRLFKGFEDWLGGSDENEYPEEHQQATHIAQRCASHFSFVLQSIAERIAHAAGRTADRNVMPVSPEQISYHFIMSCRNIQFGPSEVQIVLQFLLGDRNARPVGIIELCPTGHAGFDAVTFIIKNKFFLKVIDKNRSFRSWPNHAHFTDDHVVQLRHFIEVGLAQYVSNGGRTWIIVIRPYGTGFFSALNHRSELKDLKYAPIKANTLLLV